jgi:hypothetical protein
MEAQQAQPAQPPQRLSMVEERDQQFIHQLKSALPSVNDTSIEEYYAIKAIFNNVFAHADGHQRRRLRLETIIDAITDFVDKTPLNGENKIKSILSSAVHLDEFITALCVYLSKRSRTQSETYEYMVGIVNRIDALVPPAPAGPADGSAVFPDEQGGKRRSIKKRRKSMSKRRKNRRKSNKKQRRR